MDWVLAIMFLIGLFVVLPVVLLLIRDRIFFPRPTREQIEEHGRRFRERLRNPDFLSLEEHFGCRAPEALRRLHQDKDEVLRGDFLVVPPGAKEESEFHYVCYFCPVDADSIKDVLPGLEKYFAFADDGGGNGYLIDPTLDDPPVLYHDHESGEIEKVCDSLSEFLSWERREPEE